MKKSFLLLKFSSFTLGYTFLSFLVYGLAVDTYQFWVSGIKKQARVVSQGRDRTLTIENNGFILQGTFLDNHDLIMK
ncbi:hypothetical protein VSWAT3_08838 [Vibrionales bacterium SWAT-3]|nr:hypothetical protein VSWAT3_08838 [Vibrionales bacterium SWAT-3]